MARTPVNRTAYLDACFLIYLVEDAGVQSQAARMLLQDFEDHVLCISPLVRLEVLTGPSSDGNTDLVKRYERLIAVLWWLPMADSVYDAALGLRSQIGLKTPDALHLATAQQHGCEELWTSDGRLSRAGREQGLTVRTV